MISFVEVPRSQQTQGDTASRWHFKALDSTFGFRCHLARAWIADLQSSCFVDFDPARKSRATFGRINFSVAMRARTCRYSDVSWGFIGQVRRCQDQLLASASIVRKGTGVLFADRLRSLRLSLRLATRYASCGLPGGHSNDAEGRHGYYCKQHFGGGSARRVGVERAVSRHRPRPTLRSRSGAEKSGGNLPALSGHHRVRRRGTRQPDGVRCLGWFDRTPTSRAAEAAPWGDFMGRIFRRPARTR